MISNAKRGCGNVLDDARFEVVVCKGCGATQLFSAASKSLLDELDHETVDVARTHPFR
jgi:hypothetical protein